MGPGLVVLSDEGHASRVINNTLSSILVSPLATLDPI